MKFSHSFQYLILAIGLCSGLNCVQGQTTVDSLVNLLYTLPNNSTKVEVLGELSEQYYESNTDTLLLYARMEYKLSAQIQDSKGQMSSLLDIGLAYVYKNNVDTALSYYIRALKISEKVNDSERGALCYIRIGNLYRIQNNFDKAIEGYEMASKFYRELNNESGLASALINTGAVYYDKYDSENAQQYFEEALSIYERIGDDIGTADALSHLGAVYQDLSQYDKALTNYEHAKTEYEKLNSQIGVLTCLINIGYVYDLQGKHQKALDVQKKSLALAHEIDSDELKAAIYYGLGEIYKNLHNADSSFKYMNLYAEYKDTLFSEQSNRNIADMQTKYETDKKEKENQILRQEKQIRELKEIAAKEIEKRKLEEKSRRDNLQYSVILFFILMLVVVLLLLAGTKATWLSPRIIEGFIFLSFLIFFEFLLVLFDPYVDSITGGAPGWKLLVNAIVALAIFPLHAFFEKILKKKLLKNKI